MRRVGYDIRPALFDYAGVGRYVRELAVALTRIESAPFLEMFAPSWRGGQKIPKGLEANRYKIHRGFLPGRVMDKLHHIPGLDAGRFPAKVDVFHWTDFAWPRVRSAATVMTLHDAGFAVDPSFHGWKTSNLLDRVRRMLAIADLVIVPSEPCRKDAELLGVEPDKVRVIPHGVSPLFRRPEAPKEPNNKFLLSVGTLEPRKNYSRTLKAMEVAWANGVEENWVIVGGRGSESQDFLNRCSSSQWAEKIQLIPQANDEELCLMYQQATALVHSSLHEGFGLPVLEAMACGTAVVVGDGTAASWVAGEAGLRVDPHEVDSIAEGIERIATEDWWRNQASAVLGIRAADFTWETTAQATAEAYEEAIEIRQSR